MVGIASFRLGSFHCVFHAKVRRIVAPTYKRLKGRLPGIVKQEGATVRTVIQILRALLQEEPYCCEGCSGTDFREEPLPPDPAYARYHVLRNARRGPPAGLTRAPSGTPASPKVR